MDAGAALGVGRSGERALLARMHHDDLTVGGQRDGDDGERAEVDQQGVVGDAEGGGELIEQSAGYADGADLGGLREAREIETRHLGPERERGGDLE